MTSQVSLDERLEFAGLDAEARATLKKLKPAIAKAVGPALDAFYAKVRTNAHTKQFFSSDQHMAGAKGRQEQHWNIIADAQYGDDYIKAVRGIGTTHARLGLEPRWYIGGYTLVTEQLVKSIVKEFWPGRFNMASSPDAMGKAVASLIKAVMIDIDLAVSIYLEALDKEREEAERARAAAADEQARAMTALTAALAKVAKGDLTARLEETIALEFDAIKGDFNGAIAALERALGQVTEIARGIGGSSDEIGQAADDLSRRTEQQAASLEETAAAVGQLADSVKRAAEDANLAATKVVTAKKEAQRSGDIVRSAVTAMSEIEKSSREISQIIGVIDEIAFQTNLLALNAGVEAARAGEAGRGFAVVAQEVRALAQRSAEAAKEIKTLISASTGQVEQGVKLMAETGEASERIIGQVTEIDTLVSAIAGSSREQSTGLAEVNVAVGQMDQATQQNAAMVEETTAAVQSLRGEASQLVTTIAGFKVSGPGKAEPRKAPPAPAAKKPVPEPKRTPAAVYATQGNAAVAVSEDGWEEF